MKQLLRKAGMVLGVVAMVGGGLGWTPQAEALTIVDPDAFAAGTDISGAFAGVTLSASGAGVDGKVFSRTNTTFASTGTRDFGNSDGGFESPLKFDIWGNGPGITFRADFDVLTDFVSIDVIPDNGFDPATLSAFDAGGTLLASFTTSGTSGSTVPEIASITRVTADIAFITVFDSSNNYHLDNLQFNPIPEPGTILLLGSVLAGLVAWRMKKAKV